MTYLAESVEADLQNACTEEQRVMALLPVAETMAGHWVKRHRLADADETLSDAHLALIGAIKSWDGESNLLHWARFKINRGFVDGLRERRGRIGATEEDERMRQRILAPGDILMPLGEDGSTTLIDVLTEDGSAIGATDLVELRLDLEAAARALSKQQWRVVQARYLHEIALSEIAQAEGMSVRMLTRVLQESLAALSEQMGLPARGRSRQRTGRESLVQRQWRELANSRQMVAA